MKKFLGLLFLVSLVGCCNEMPHYEHKVKRVFNRCRMGGKNVRPVWDKSRIMQANETTGGMKFPDGECVSVAVGSADYKPTVLVASISCVASSEGPFFTIEQIVNPYEDRVLVLPICAYYRFSIDTHVMGSVAWMPFVGDEWSKSDEGGWEDE